MSESWFEGVGLAESPFADEVEAEVEAEAPFAGEVEAPAEAWPSESAGLPPSWPEEEEEEEEGARGELSFATEAWSPWAPAEALGEAEEQVTAAGLSSSRLEWPGASAAQLAFMRAVYDRHMERSRAKGGTFTADLPEEALGDIEGSHRARKDAAAAARALLAAARAALTAAGLAGKARIGIVSAYRPASKQFEIWQGKGRKGGFPYYYRQMLQRGRLGNHGPEAVAAMATEIAKWIAAPGYSNHQDGLAIDFGAGSVATGKFGAIGERAWFHKWLVANAARHGFHPYEKEAWHWVYRGPPGSTAPPGTSPPSRAATGLVRPGELPVDRVPLLAGHHGRQPDLILRWNVPSVPEEIDVVVHLHGFWYPKLSLDRDVKPISGLDLTPVGGAPGTGRSRPTLTVLPRGHDTRVKQKKGPYNAYSFPALVTRDGLPELVRFSLERFAAAMGGARPRVGRLILTAHSGGGAALLQILQYHDPHQVHVFDGLYQPATALADWARRRMGKDRAALAGLGAASAREYMSTRGGTLRVFYGGGTRKRSRELQTAIASELHRGLEPWYRVERSRHSHLEIPKRHGWRVLADASADDPDAYTEPGTHREADLEGGGFEAGSFDQWEEPESEMEDLEAEDLEDEEELEGYFTHASEEALDRLEPFGDEAESPGADEAAPAGRGLLGRVLEQSVLVAAIAAGERSEKVLTDRIFRLRHPDPTGAGIAKNDEAAKLEWRQIRDRQVLPMLLTGPFIGPMHGSLATAPPGADLRKGVPPKAKLSPLSITRRGLRKAKKFHPGTIAAIVVHTTSRGPANRSRARGFRRPAIDYALDYYLNGDGGYPHYVVDFNGTIYATCDERYVAWHAGWVHPGGAKLFKSGWKAPDWWSRVWHQQQAATPIDLLPKGAGSPNYRTIGIELLLLPDMSYTPQQYQALARLVVDIQRRNPDVQIPAAPSRGLLGHEDFAPVTGEGGRADAQGGWDPGAHRDSPFFDWQRLWSEIQAVRSGPGAGGEAEVPDGQALEDVDELEELPVGDGGEPLWAGLTQDETDEAEAAEFAAGAGPMAGEGLFADAIKAIPQAAAIGVWLRDVTSGAAPTKEAQAFVDRLIAGGNLDKNKLTDIVFRVTHLGVGTRPLDKSNPSDQPLIRDWLKIRDDLVLPALRRHTTGGHPAVPDRPPPERVGAASAEQFIAEHRERLSQFPWRDPAEMRLLTEAIFHGFRAPVFEADSITKSGRRAIERFRPPVTAASGLPLIHTMFMNRHPQRIVPGQLYAPYKRKDGRRELKQQQEQNRQLTPADWVELDGIQELVFDVLRYVLPQLTPRPTVSRASGLGERIAARAHCYLGVRYALGGWYEPRPDKTRSQPATLDCGPVLREGRGALDCSGLVNYVYWDVRGCRLKSGSSCRSGVECLYQLGDFEDLGSPTGADGRPRATPLAGDLLLRKEKKTKDKKEEERAWQHVAIFVGDDHLIDAWYTGTVVRKRRYVPDDWEYVLRFKGDGACGPRTGSGSEFLDEGLAEQPSLWAEVEGQEPDATGWRDPHAGERKVQLDVQPRYLTHAKPTVREYTTYSPHGERPKAEVRRVTGNASFVSRVLRIIAADKHFEGLTGLDGLTIGIGDFAAGSDISFLFAARELQPTLFRTIFGAHTDEMMQGTSRRGWLSQHASRLNDHGLIAIPWLRKGIARLLADQRFYGIQLAFWQRDKVAPSLATFSSYGFELEFSLAAMCGMANSMGPGGMRRLLRKGKAAAEAAGKSGREREIAILRLACDQYAHTGGTFRNDEPEEKRRKASAQATAAIGHVFDGGPAPGDTQHRATRILRTNRAFPLRQARTFSGDLGQFALEPGERAPTAPVHELQELEQELELQVQLELEEEFPVGEAFLDEDDDDIPRPLDELDRLDQLTEA